MSDGINVGSVEVDVVPNASGFSDSLRRQVTPDATKLGDELGRIIGSQISDQIARGVRDGLRGAGDPSGQGAAAGDSYGGAFSRTVKARIDAALRDLPNPVITVDSSEADRKIADLRAQLESLRAARIGIDIDSADATARLEQIRSQLADLGAGSTDVGVRADTAAARAELDRVRADLDELNGRTVDVTVRERTTGDGGNGGNGGGGGGLASILTGLAPLAVPLGGAAIAGAAGLGAGVAGAAGAFAVAKLGLDGVTTAATDATAAQQAAGQAAAQSANQSAAADYAVANAKIGVADAVRAASQSVAQSLQQQQSAEHALATAQYSEQQAQQTLTQARISAKQAIEDLTNSVADGALAQRQATLNVQTAQQALAKTLANPASTELQRQQAQLTYDQAVQQVTDLHVRQTRLVAQQQAAAKAGVNGSTQVISAQHGVATATQGVINAQQKLKNATAAVAEARRAGAENIAKAQAAEANAIRQQAVATSQVNTAARTAAAAMAALTPQGRQFAQFILGTLDPAFKKIKDTAQAGLLPGLETGIKAALPILPLILNLVKSFSTALGTLFTQAGKALNSPFWKQFFTYLATTAGPIIQTIGKVLGDFAKIAAGLFQAFGPLITQVGAGLVGLLDKFAAFATGATKNAGFQAFMAYIEKTGPLVADALGKIFVVVGHLIEGLAPLGAVLIKVIDVVATFLAQLSPNQLLGLIGAVTAGIVAYTVATSAASGATALAAAPVLAVVAAVVALAAILVIAYQKSSTFRDIVNQIGDFLAHVLYPVLKKIAEDALAGLRDAFHYVSDAIQAHRAQLDQLWTILKDVIGFIVTQVLPVVGTILKQMFQALGLVVVAFIDTLSALVDAFHWVVDNSKILYHDVVGFFTSLSTDTQKIFTTLASAIVVAFGAVKSGLAGIWNDVEQVFATGVNFVTQKILNPLIGILNDVLGVFGIKIGKIPSITIGSSGSSSATGSNPGNGLAGGLGHKGFKVGGVLPGYSPGVDNLALPQYLFSGGEGILVPEATRALGGAAGIQAINSTYSSRVSSSGLTAGHGRFGIGGIVGDIGSGISGAVGDVTSALSSAVDSVTGLIRAGAADAAIAALKVAEAPVKLVLKAAPSSFAAKFGNGIFDTLNSKVADFIRGNTATVSGGFTQGVGAIPTGQHLSLIQQALALAGVSANSVNEAAVNTIVAHESGWNPSAINLTDSNAQAGHPSQGLMQTIPSTFEAYRLSSLPDVITNPVANLVAGIRYAVANYGSLSNVPGVKAVADGSSYVGYDSGGYLPPGVTTVFNGTGRPEPVFTGGQFDKMMNRMDQGYGGPVAQLNVYPQPGQSEHAIGSIAASQLAFQLRAAGVGR